MRRILLLATLAVGVLATIPGAASADVDFPIFGDAPDSYPLVELQDEYLTLNSSNQVVPNGVKVGFFVSEICTAGEAGGFFAYATQADPPQGPPEGGGAAGTSCNGVEQFAFVIAQRKTLPLFDSVSNLAVRGISFSANANNLTDLMPGESTLEPFDPNNDAPEPIPTRRRR